MHLNDQKSKRIRAFSAKPVRSRPLSGSSKGGYQKTQFIESVYGGGAINLVGPSNVRKSINLTGSKRQLETLSKIVPKNSTKQKQQLFQQNLHLKKQINKLTQQLAIMKGQMQSIKKPMNKTNKQLNMQFEKQMYWKGSNSHLVAGVKARYQQLKQKYQKKCDQCQLIKKDVQFLQIQEFKIYSQSLQNENKRLRQMLEKFTNWTDIIGNKQSNQVIQYMLSQSQQKRIRIQKKLIQTQKNYKSASEVINQRDKKIAFLQKLIIQKDNNQHHANQKLKKVDKQKNAYQLQLIQTKATLKEKQQYYQTNIQKNYNNMEKKFQAQKDLFDQTILLKETQIQKLQKQVAYLTTLLSYWKPIDQANKQVADHLMKKQGENNEQSKSILFTSGLRQNKNQSIIVGNISSHKNKEGQNNTRFLVKQSEANMKQSIINKSKIIQQLPKKRERQTAQKKHSQQAQKKRKINNDQIEQIGMLLRFRFIAQNISIQQVKSKFNYNSFQSNFVLTQDEHEKKQQEQQWNKKHISMKQAISTLKGSIFNLSQQQAWTLSRYLVEDCNNQYIYCDANNEIEREIVKSIIKTVVGDYQTYDEQKLNKIEKEMSYVVENYKANLGPALKTVASNGIISKKKFLQMVSNLGIQISEDCKQMFIAKMALKSQGLQKLNYQLYF